MAHPLKCWKRRKKELLDNIASLCWVFFFLKFNFYLFIYLWLCWVFVSVWGLSLVVASGGHSSSRCAGLSLSRPLLLWSTGSRRAGSAIVAHGPSCSAACGIFPDQGSNLCPLNWQADSQPLRHQGSPLCWVFLQGIFTRSHCQLKVRNSKPNAAWGRAGCWPQVTYFIIYTVNPRMCLPSRCGSENSLPLAGTQRRQDSSLSVTESAGRSLGPQHHGQRIPGPSRWLWTFSWVRKNF